MFQTKSFKSTNFFNETIKLKKKWLQIKSHTYLPKFHQVTLQKQNKILNKNNTPSWQQLIKLK